MITATLIAMTSITTTTTMITTKIRKNYKRGLVSPARPNAALRSACEPFMAIRCATRPCRSSHGLCHQLIAAKRLCAQRDCLELRSHLVELLDMPPRAHQIASQHLACHLSLVEDHREGGAYAFASSLSSRSCQGLLGQDAHHLPPPWRSILISITSFFSCCSSLVLSRSSSRCAFCSVRWCCRIPNRVSIDDRGHCVGEASCFPIGVCVREGLGCSLAVLAMLEVRFATA